MTERKWRFGTLKVNLDAEKFGLDEDGWIECRAQLSARDIKATAGTDATVFDLVPSLLSGWNLKVDGEEIPFNRDDALDLPVEILMAVIEELQKQPFFSRHLAAAETTETS